MASSPSTETGRRAPAFVPALDGLRGILTLVVLFHHVFTSVFFILPKEATASWWPHTSLLLGSEITLPIYFVISGFVIFLPAARGNGSLGDLKWYALRRVARIVPAYYVMLLVLILGWPFLIQDVPSPMATGRGVELLFGHLVFLQKALYDEVDIGFGMNGSVWTLTLEEFFYASIPLAAPFFFRRPLRTLGVAFALGLSWRLGCLFLPELARFFSAPAPDALLPAHLFHQFPGYVFQFACGSAAARLYVLNWGRFDSPAAQRALRIVHHACLLILFAELELAGIFRTPRNGIPLDLQRDMTPALVFAILILAVALGPEENRKLYTNRICRFLGDTSYGVYLWHMVLIQVVYRAFHLERATAAGAAWTLSVWVLPGSLVLGYLSFRFLERPLSLYARRVWTERQAVPAPSAG
ncbi:MAG TPA: acyltransferase [Polyangiaceae bacterium]|nr:acyltransferase [Polyangiaceae bacterium]